MKDVELQAVGALRLLLEQVPTIKFLDIQHEALTPNHGVDIVARIEVSGRRHALVCEVKSSGQPRHVRLALLQLRDFVANQAKDASPVFIAPYLSPEAVKRGIHIS